ncbi:polysaccharide biosynthesis protein [Evansella tamaricis]|uniref:Polysaccharide biosynthesis protein n=1 Tax=Evansella tamaricis TaxID=2069301 RepID=A0ABS6JEU5_9BACI|nr:nucleoside-diphosphate sugar epimerase/dehydratase [Evansella tamaricis]MBU9712161.1 polysaccharide biosynthesis protein [Evansella tamaricis]
MAYHQRLSLLILIDSSFIIVAFLLSKVLLYETFDLYHHITVSTLLSLIVFHHFFSKVYKLYKKAWEYASIGELLIILKIVSFSIFFTAIIQLSIDNAVHLRMLFIIWLIQMSFIGGSRFTWRAIRDSYFKTEENRKRTLIIGAGAAGTMIARQLIKNNDSSLLPVAFIDDDHRKHNLDILGIPVIGGVNQLESAVSNLMIENIVIAIPSLNSRELNRIFKECAKTNINTKTLPMIEDLVTGKVSIEQFRDVEVEDLLGREPVKLDMEGISEYITNKVVIVTGAGGSIGSEICRQIARFLPKHLILLGHGENSIYSIEMELRDLYSEQPIKFFPEIADIQDAEKIQQIMNLYRPDVVYHAAAHKHVPLMEHSPEEAVKNNLLGTLNVANAAHLTKVKTFVLISSDKAVNPTSVMGATKRLAEMSIQHLNKTSKTNFIAVRFGNVLGSRGSVIPLFKKQIKNGGPVTITHPEMVRYFMTIPEASRLVIQAGSLAKGGEIFVLDMGEPVKILDLAKNLVTLSGNSIDDIGISFTGMRPGEKLFEELLNDNEVHEKQIYPNIYIGKASESYVEEIGLLLKTYSQLDKEVLRQTLIQLANRKHHQNSAYSMPG